MKTIKSTPRGVAQLCVIVFLVTAGCGPEEANGPAPSPGISPVASTPATAPASPNLGPAFDASSETLYLAARPSDLAKLEPLQQATIAEAADGIAIQATGNDPALFLPEFPVKPCIVKIEISAPADTAIQIFYLTGTQTVYTEPNSAVQRLKSGKNLTYFKIDKPDLTGKWRLDPGGVSGTYIIHGIEIRAVGATSPVAH